MEEGAYLGSVIAGALYVIAGARLARLSLRTGELPEAALATCFLCWGVSYFAYAIPTALADESLIARCFFTGAILGDVGAVAAAVFTWKVFRAKAAWARVLVGAIALAFVASNAGHAAVGDFEGSSPLTSVWYWLRWTGATVACACRTSPGCRPLPVITAPMPGPAPSPTPRSAACCCAWWTRAR